MGAIFGIIGGLLLIALVCGGLASAIDGSQTRSAEKISDTFLDKVAEICEEKGVEYTEPEEIKVPTEIGYRISYTNEVKVNLPNKKMDRALYMIDEEQDVLFFVSSNDFFAIDMDKIKMYTLDGSIRYNSIVKNNGKNVSLSGAIIGGAIAGPAGMVIGATKDRNNITTEIEKNDERKVYIYYEDDKENIKLITVEKGTWGEQFNFDTFIRNELPTKSDVYLTSQQQEDSTKQKDNGSIESALARIKKMYEDGLISEEDYNSKKQEILSKLDI